MALSSLSGISMSKHLALSVLVAALSLPSIALSAPKSSLLQNGFEGEEETRTWAVMYGAEITPEQGRTGPGALHINAGEASIRTRESLSEQGLLELWIKTSSPATQYRINVLVASSQNDDAGWIQVGQISGNSDTADYHAKRISIDDPAKRYLRLDVETENGEIWIDDVRIEKILLDTALQKNQQKIISEVLDKLRDNKNYQVQADELRTLGKHYAEQIDVQRQYLEYANGIYSSVTLVLATSERGKMANPLAYQTFKGVVADVGRVASPLQRARMDSLLKPLGNAATTALNVMTYGAFTAFAEPFKTIVATAFEKSAYENADLDRATRKFAEKNGLATYNKTEGFMTEIEKEIKVVTALDTDLLEIKRSLEKYRSDLDKHLRESLIAGGLGRGQDNYNRVTSKDQATRSAALKEIDGYFTAQAESFQNHSSSNTQFVRFMMKATSNVEQTQLYKERFNEIAASVITFYDTFDRSIAPEQNPFSNETDRNVWEANAKKVRAYIQESKAAFRKAYL